MKWILLVMLAGFFGFMYMANTNPEGLKGALINSSNVVINSVSSDTPVTTTKEVDVIRNTAPPISSDTGSGSSAYLDANPGCVPYFDKGQLCPEHARQ